MEPIHVCLVTGPRNWWEHFTIQTIESDTGRFLGVNVRTVEYSDFRELNREHVVSILDEHLRRKTIQLMRVSQDPTATLEEIANEIDTTAMYLRFLANGVLVSFETVPDSQFRTSQGNIDFCK